MHYIINRIYFSKKYVSSYTSICPRRWQYKIQRLRLGENGGNVSATKPQKNNLKKSWGFFFISVMTSHDQKKRRKGTPSQAEYYPLKLKQRRFALFVIVWRSNVFPISAQVVNEFKQPPDDVTKWTECILALAELLHLHRLELKPSEGRRQFEEAADGRRTVLSADKHREHATMAENKIGPNLQAGAGFLAKRVQKSLNRAQEKVS